MFEDRLLGLLPRFLDVWFSRRYRNAVPGCFQASRESPQRYMLLAICYKTLLNLPFACFSYMQKPLRITIACIIVVLRCVRILAVRIWTDTTEVGTSGVSFPELPFEARHFRDIQHTSNACMGLFCALNLRRAIRDSLLSNTSSLFKCRKLHLRVGNFSLNLLGSHLACLWFLF